MEFIQIYIFETICEYKSTLTIKTYRPRCYLTYPNIYSQNGKIVESFSNKSNLVYIFWWVVFLCLIHILIHKGEGKLYAPPSIIGIFFCYLCEIFDLCNFDTWMENRLRVCMVWLWDFIEGKKVKYLLFVLRHFKIIIFY